MKRFLHCRCRQAKVVAEGLLHAALVGRALLRRLARSAPARDGRRCRVCHTPERGKRTLAVHDRVLGRPRIGLGLGLMLTLCLGCHAKVTRTGVLRADLPPLLRTLWREQHPGAHEQGQLDFRAPVPALATAPLFANGEEGK